MSYQPLLVQTPDYDTDLIKDGARLAIIANHATWPFLKLSGDDPAICRVFPDAAPAEKLEDADGIARSKLCKVILRLPSVVTERTYSHVTFNALLDVAVYKEGWPDANVRALMVQIIKAVAVLPWNAPGASKTTVLSTGPGVGFRPLSELNAGVLTRGKGATLRVIVQL